jgi:hypothetical protein
VRMSTHSVVDAGGGFGRMSERLFHVFCITQWGRLCDTHCPLIRSIRFSASSFNNICKPVGGYVRRAV